MSCPNFGESWGDLFTSMANDVIFIKTPSKVCRQGTSNTSIPLLSCCLIDQVLLRYKRTDKTRKMYMCSHGFMDMLLCAIECHLVFSMAAETIVIELIHDQWLLKVIVRMLEILLSYSTAKNSTRIQKMKLVKYIGTHLISGRKPNLVITNKTKRIYYIADLANPLAHRMKIKENEKISKYFDLARELRKLWNMRVMMLPIVIGTLGMVPKGIERGLKGL